MKTEVHKNIIVYASILQNRQTKQTANYPFKYFRGNYILLEEDFIQLSGVDVTKHKAFYSMDYFTAGQDWNVWERQMERAIFIQKYGFDCGDADSMVYLYPSGVQKAIEILKKAQVITNRQKNEKNDRKLIQKICLL